VIKDLGIIVAGRTMNNPNSEKAAAGFVNKWLGVQNQVKEKFFP
jgi:hypothetical protein